MLNTQSVVCNPAAANINTKEAKKAISKLFEILRPKKKREIVANIRKKSDAAK